MSDRVDLTARILANRREHTRRLDGIRQDAGMGAADRTAAIANEYRRASQRHDELVRQYRAPVEGEADNRELPKDPNGLIRMSADDARFGPRSGAMRGDLIATMALPVPPEIAG